MGYQMVTRPMTSRPIRLPKFLYAVNSNFCSLYFNFPKSQINRLQQIHNCLARTVVKAPKSSLVTPILRSLHWLKINERIE